VSSAEPVAPNPTRSSAPEQSDPSTVVQVTTTVLPTGGHGCKHSPPATRHNKPFQQVDQVMTQIELPPYHRPRSPLDLGAVKIVFRHIFEVFQYISHATAAGAMTDDNDRLMKRSRPPSL
jgi:hypothetical protein